ncbi:MAG: SDR family NAD(P)-dependent oxidoreductase, partial [Planctomycetota bacterium]
MICEDLKDKRVLVTGSSSGIGAAAAELFSSQGSFLGVHYFQTRDGAEETLRQVRENSDGLLLCADLRDRQQAGEMVDRFAAQAGG